MELSPPNGVFGRRPAIRSRPAHVQALSPPALWGRGSNSPIHPILSHRVHCPFHPEWWLPRTLGPAHNRPIFAEPANPSSSFPFSLPCEIICAVGGRNLARRGSARKCRTGRAPNQTLSSPRPPDGRRVHQWTLKTRNLTGPLSSPAPFVMALFLRTPPRRPRLQEGGFPSDVFFVDETGGWPPGKKPTSRPRFGIQPAFFPRPVLTRFIYVPSSWQLPRCYDISKFCTYPARR